jgi:RHS repeat-associated protein
MNALMQRFSRPWLAKLAFLAMALVASVTGRANTVTYVYSDPQGTPLAEANSSGVITATYDYAPYGAGVSNNMSAVSPNGIGYTGHVNDPDTGLVYMQARYYDPSVGRFISTDPVGPEASNLANFNRFAYANNNPIVNMDPDGRCTGSSLSNSDGSCLGGGGGFTAGAGYTTFVNSADSAGGGKSSYTQDSGVAKQAIASANNALKDAYKTTYRSIDSAEKVYSSLVQPISNKFNTEIGSKLFDMGYGFKIGGATSDGTICSTVCNINIRIAPDIPGGTFAGFTHTHQNNLGLSPYDLQVAYDMGKNNYFYKNPVSVYASGPNGSINAWSTKAMSQKPQGTWIEYIKNTSTWIKP